MNKALADLEKAEWSSLTYEEKNRLLFLRQKKTLDMFLERGAISQAQHDKSLHDLIEKMGMAQFDVYSTAVQNIISWIVSGEVAIPEIQRPFVWDTTKVRDLLDSLYNGFPVGYIIVWKNPDVKLRDGSISSGKKILIDGQQRVTALQAAISERVFIIPNLQIWRVAYVRFYRTKHLTI